MAKFILSKKILLDQVGTLENLGLKISYSYKTNKEVGNLLQDISDVDFSIHVKEEIGKIKNKSRIWFFLQAESEDELTKLIEKGVVNFVIDNEIDLKKLLDVVNKLKKRINLSLRMKFQEHRITSGKYFVYGMSSRKINEIVLKVGKNKLINKLGIHIHRKSQNTSEWEIEEELKDSLSEETFERINFLNLGGGLPITYRSYTSEVLDYIFVKLKKVKEFLEKRNIEAYIEPGRFLAGPCIKLETQVIQIQGRNLIIDTTIYNCALDSVLTGTKMLVEREGEGKDYLIKGNSPTRDDIFRYNVKLENLKVGDKIVFLNAGAYNYTTDFFGYKKLETKMIC